MLPVENKYKKCALFWGAILQDILESSRYIHLDDEPSNIVLFTIYKKKLQAWCKTLGIAY